MLEANGPSHEPSLQPLAIVSAEPICGDRSFSSAILPIRLELTPQKRYGGATIEAPSNRRPAISMQSMWNSPWPADAPGSPASDRYF
jgi:hypothetical protein